MLKLKDAGERLAIDRLMSMHTRQSPKDDCSVLEFGDISFMISVDSITPETHIPKGASNSLAGKFFANVTMSDVASMAGVPVGFMAAYTAPMETEMEFLEDFESGVNSVLQKYDIEHLGGDLKEGRELTMTGIALGRQRSELIRKRSHIRSGQILGVTNKLGRSASGYVFYKTGYRRDYGIGLMLGAEARFREAEAISRNGGKFMMDLSDGVFSSISQMKNDYGLGFKIVEDSVPADPNADKAAELSGAALKDLLLSYGGDYELLFTLENENYGKFMEAMESEDVDVSIIGQVWDGENLIFDGERWESVRDRGYEHFKAKPPLGSIA